jgi:hypothetical protein
VQRLITDSFAKAAQGSDGTFSAAEAAYMWAIDRPATDPIIRTFFAEVRADLQADVSEGLFLPMKPSEALLLDHPWLAANDALLAELDAIDTDFADVYRPLTAGSTENMQAVITNVVNLAKFQFDNLDQDLSGRAGGRRGTALAGALGIPDLMWGKAGDASDKGMMQHFSAFVIRRLIEIRKTPEGAKMFQKAEIDVAEHAARNSRRRR